MSYILDALKKSEQERKKGEVPGLGTLQGLPGSRFAGDRPLWHYGLGAILLVATLTGLVWLLLGEPAPEPAPEPVPPAMVEAPAATTAPGNAAKIATLPSSAPKAGSQNQPARTPIAPAASAKPRQEKTAASTLPPPSMPAPVKVNAPDQPLPAAVEAPPPEPPGEEATKEYEEAEAPAKPEEMPTVPLEELPAEIRAEMPEVKIGVHFYSDTPASRRASVNGRLMREGETVDKELVLLEITRQGAILAFRGRKFSLPVFPR